MSQPRQSNIELLRLLSMLGVLTVHADFGALGWPDHAEFVESGIYCVLRCFVEAFALMSVNVFVLISGWFGIKFRWKGLSNLLFQCFFFFFGIYAVCVAVGVREFGFRGIYECLMLGGNAWFVKAYIGMYLFAPVMNAFIEHSDKLTLRRVLISLFAFQTIYGWMSQGAEFIEDGYSAFSFSLLYMLARYVRKYRPGWSRFRLGADLLLYVCCSAVTGTMFTLSVAMDKPVIINYFFAYTSPFIIAAAMYLMLAFTKFSFTNRLVNDIAASCFAVYLFHFILFPTFISVGIRDISSAHDSVMSFFLIAALLICFYAAAIIADRVRLFIWRRFLLPRFAG